MGTSDALFAKAALRRETRPRRRERSTRCRRERRRSRSRSRSRSKIINKAIDLLPVSQALALRFYTVCIAMRLFVSD